MKILPFDETCFSPKNQLSFQCYFCNCKGVPSLWPPIRTIGSECDGTNTFRPLSSYLDMYYTNKSLNLLNIIPQSVEDTHQDC